LYYETGELWYIGGFKGHQFKREFDGGTEFHKNGSVKKYYSNLMDLEAKYPVLACSKEDAMRLRREARKKRRNKGYKQLILFRD